MVVQNKRYDLTEFNKKYSNVGKKSKVRYYIGDIITTPYTDQDGYTKTMKIPSSDRNLDFIEVEERGIFMIVNIVGGHDLRLRKITSHPTGLLNDDLFEVLLERRDHPFLRTDSYVQMNKEHTCRISDKITKIGSISSHVSGKIFDIMKDDYSFQLNQWQGKAIADDRKNSIERGDSYVSPNLRNKY